jgi:hypothetical protein
MQTEIEQMRAQMEQMRVALLELAALNAWSNFGECRAFDTLGRGGRILTPAEADALARKALGV